MTERRERNGQRQRGEICGERRGMEREVRESDRVVEVCERLMSQIVKEILGETFR